MPARSGRRDGSAVSPSGRSCRVSLHIWVRCAADTARSPLVRVRRERCKDPELQGSKSSKRPRPAVAEGRIGKQKKAIGARIWCRAGPSRSCLAAFGAAIRQVGHIRSHEERHHEDREVEHGRTLEQLPPVGQISCTTPPRPGPAGGLVAGGAAHPPRCRAWLRWSSLGPAWSVRPRRGPSRQRASSCAAPGSD